MTLQVSYMGTKRGIAPLVGDLVAGAPDGPFLDLFAGICTVGEAVGPPRPIWSNDAQFFGAAVAQAFFGSRSLPPTFEVAASLAYPHYLRNRIELEERFRDFLEAEASALKRGDAEHIARAQSAFATIATSKNLDAERVTLSLQPQAFPYRLFSITYAGGYVGLRQSIDIDSIRYAIDY